MPHDAAWWRDYRRRRRVAGNPVGVTRKSAVPPPPQPATPPQPQPATTGTPVPSPATPRNEIPERSPQLVFEKTGRTRVSEPGQELVPKGADSRRKRVRWGNALFGGWKDEE
jgi:hypothetical protein